MSKKINDLQGYHKNPRKITISEQDLLKEKLQKLGDLSGIVHELNTNEIISGNQRSAIFSLEHSEIEITEEYPEPTATGTVAIGYVWYRGEKFSYRAVRWDAKTAEEANIVANKVGGDWDMKMINELFNAEELLTWGFTEAELGIVQDVEPEPEEGEVDPVPPVVPISVKGDLYEMNEHRVLCGSSTEADAVGRLFGSKKSRLIVTDPPYNVDYVGKTKDALKIENDKMSNDGFYQFLLDFYTLAFSYAEPGAPAYIFHADTEGINFRKAFIDAGFKLSECLMWVKQSMVMGRQDYHWKHEPILYGWKEGAAHPWYTDRKQTTVLEFDRPSRNPDHPTMKPLDILEYLIGNSSQVGEIVADYFLGSGSTLMASEKTGRICYGTELGPNYTDVIVRRWLRYMKENDRPYLIKRNGKELTEAEVNAILDNK